MGLLWKFMGYSTAYIFFGRMCRASPCGLSSVSAHRVARFPLSFYRYAKRRYAELLLRRSGEALLTQSPFALLVLNLAGYLTSVPDFRIERFDSTIKSA
jgi:hypothetical protein